MTQGQEIKAARIELGIKAKDLAATLGITPEHLSRVENDHRPVTVMFALAVAEALRKGVES